MTWMLLFCGTNDNPFLLYFSHYTCILCMMSNSKYSWGQIMTKLEHLYFRLPRNSLDHFSALTREILGNPGLDREVDRYSRRFSSALRSDGDGEQIAGGFGRAYERGGGKIFQFLDAKLSYEQWRMEISEKRFRDFF